MSEPYRYGCVHCNSVSINKVRKGNHDRLAERTHIYCNNCLKHSRVMIDKKTKRQVTV